MSSYCESGYLSRYGAINDSLNNDALTLKEMLLDFFFYVFWSSRSMKREKRASQM